MSTVETYQFDLVEIGPRDVFISQARGTWAQPDRRRVVWLDRDGVVNTEVIQQEDRQFYRRADEKIWQENMEYLAQDSLSYGDISGFRIVDALAWKCEPPYELASDRSCLLAVVENPGTSNGGPATFGQIYVLDIDNEDHRLLRWSRYAAGHTRGESLAEFLEQDPESEFKTIGRTTFEYSDHDVPVSDDLFVPGDLLTSDG
ncbi:MAG: hypothetical protein HQ478_05035 [Chloroflexi bacterium]|nr:hypothetical protein [Chloroflexota bacterium]